MARPAKDNWVRLTDFMVLNPQFRAKAFGIILVCASNMEKANGQENPPNLPRHLLQFVRGEPRADAHAAVGRCPTIASSFAGLGRVLDAEGVEPTSLTLELADRLARQVPFDRMNAVRIPNLVRRFVLHLISIGVAIPPPVSAAQIAKDKLLDDLEGFLLGQRGLSPSSVYHVKRYAVRFLDHRFGETVPDPSAIRHHDIVAFLEHIQKGKSLSMARTPASPSALLLPVPVCPGPDLNQICRRLCRRYIASRTADFPGICRRQTSRPSSSGSGENPAMAFVTMPCSC